MTTLNTLKLIFLSHLKKGTHKTMIADLFQKHSIGYQHYLNYNNAEDPTQLIRERIGNKKITEEEFEAMDFQYIINVIGYEWLDELKRPDVALKVFEFGIELMPNNADLYDSMGETYFIQKEWDSSIQYYAKSLALNPSNENAIKQIQMANENRK